MLCLIHELLSNEGQVPGKQELNQMYYLALIPLLHSTFFTLTQISPQAINEIYHWHKLGRGEKAARKDEGKKNEGRVTEISGLVSQIMSQRLANANSWESLCC